MTIKLYRLFVFGLVCLTACGRAEPTFETPLSETPTIEIRATPTLPPPTLLPPYFEPGPCLLEIPARQTIDCGVLIVPEDRSNLAEPGVVRLAVAILKTKSRNPAPDPVVYLSGGPGGHALINFEQAFATWESILRERDVIVFDPRGVGFSTPNLNCPEWESNSDQDLGLDLPFEQQLENHLQATRACRERLVAQGVRLSAYTSADSAADVNDLRQALGLQQWNLYGVSYGTRLALTVLRDYPQGIRSVVLDSVVPLQVDLLVAGPGVRQRAFEQLSAACKAQTMCTTYFPDLHETLIGLYQQFNDEPLIFTVDAPEANGPPVTIRADGETLFNTIFTWLYDATAIPDVPQRIKDIAEGNYQTWQNQLGWIVFNNRFSDEGLSLSMLCREETSFSSLAAANAGLQEIDEILQPSWRNSITWIFDQCDVWDLPGAPAVENEAVESDIPVLILNGQMDPVTPPAFGELAAETLRQSQVFTFPGAGHFVLGLGTPAYCARNLVKQFLANPETKVEAACLDQIPLLTFFWR